MTLNLNGIRSAARKGFFPWFLTQQVDVLCLQETRALAEELPCDITQLPGYHSYFLSAEKKGYSGVAIYSRDKPDQLHYGMGHGLLDSEGRLLRADFASLSISSLYAPSGSSGEHRQALKDEFLEFFLPHCIEMRTSGRQHILCGDLNIAHRPIDIKNWRTNQESSGFLPHERAWVDHLLDELGLIDAFRCVQPGPDQYTWWSARGGARAKNIGWRIDYQIVTPNLRSNILRAQITPTPFFSDHAPLTIDYDYDAVPFGS